MAWMRRPVRSRYGPQHYTLKGLRFGSRLTLSNGILGIAISHATTRGALIRTLTSALVRDLKADKDFDVLGLHQLTIQARQKKIRVAIDGEIKNLRPPLEYITYPEHLQVLVP
jgi:diacylglycerol kinase family enzyme